MSKYTQCYTDFLARLKEVELLRSLARKRERQNAIYNALEINALCRGALVLLSSHIEAYVRELGERTLDKIFASGVDRSKFSLRIFYHSAKDKIEQIRETDDYEKLATKIFDFLASDAADWQRAGPLVRQLSPDRFSRGFSNPGFEKIKAYLARFGYDTYRSDFYLVLSANAQPIENSLNHLVATRNNIAHGDPGATKTPLEIASIIQDMKIFCRTTDQIFSRWCRQKYCSLR